MATSTRSTRSKPKAEAPAESESGPVTPEIGPVPAPADPAPAPADEDQAPADTSGTVADLLSDLDQDWPVDNMLYPVESNGLPDLTAELHEFDRADFALALLREVVGADRYDTARLEFMATANDVRKGHDQ
ncbi:hypothetical protein ACWCPQ_34280 [Nocardia sp. NPDC001965]